jgi:hypothetical protein
MLFSTSGAEVPQVYLGLPSSTEEPPLRLAAFRKVWLGPGEIKKIQLVIDSESSHHPFGYWDSHLQKWQIATGLTKCTLEILQPISYPRKQFPFDDLRFAVNGMRCTVRVLR